MANLDSRADNASWKCRFLSLQAFSVLGKSLGLTRFLLHSLDTAGTEQFSKFP